MYFAPSNIYLCDLEFLGADIAYLDHPVSRGKTIVQVSWPWRGPYEFLCEPSPQGLHRIKGFGVDLREFADYLARQFEPRERFTYFCFTKIRESKLRAIKFLRVLMAGVAAVGIYHFIIHKTWMNVAISAVALMLVMISFFLPRKALKFTYRDYLVDLQNRDCNGPDDFYDRFNN